MDKFQWGSMVGATTRLYNKGFSASEVGPSLQPSTQWMRPRTTNCFASVAALDNGRGRVTEKQAFKHIQANRVTDF